MKSYIDELDRNIFNFVEYEGYDDRYPSLSMQAFSSDFYDEIRHASRRLFQIFCKAAKVFQMAPDDFARNMDMPDNLIPYLHKSNALGLPTWLSRFDFVLDVNGNLRMVELNADTPCFLIESYYANEVAANYVGRKHPNIECRNELHTFLKRMYDAVLSAKYGRNQYESMRANRESLPKDPFVFSCFHDYFEDYGTTQFLMKELKTA
ncbi:MAG: glutathionylspermidine synthase family protein, partial [Veillonella atypica]|uniref:glutathionylspermidine synthase family protein n=1 Tax=Veillonella atypica TaxID=39777 RepID=UPI0039968FFE